MTKKELVAEIERNLREGRIAFDAQDWGRYEALAEGLADLRVEAHAIPGVNFADIIQDCTERLLC